MIKLKCSVELLFTPGSYNLKKWDEMLIQCIKQQMTAVDYLLLKHYFSWAICSKYRMSRFEMIGLVLGQIDTLLLYRATLIFFRILLWAVIYDAEHNVIW